MTNDAIERISGFSRGIPRLINAICDKALLAASQEKQKEISSDIVIEVAEHICVGALPSHGNLAIAGAITPPTSQLPTVESVPFLSMSRSFKAR